MQLAAEHVSKETGQSKFKHALCYHLRYDGEWRVHTTHLAVDYLNHLSEWPATQVCCQWHGEHHRLIGWTLCFDWVLIPVVVGIHLNTAHYYQDRHSHILSIPSLNAANVTIIFILLYLLKMKRKHNMSSIRQVHIDSVLTVIIKSLGFLIIIRRDAIIFYFC